MSKRVADGGKVYPPLPPLWEGRLMTHPKQKTKIVCTLGPASSDGETIRRMIRAGMSMARLNLSHGTVEEHARQIQTVRRAAEEEELVIGNLIDLPGPKIRLGQLACEPIVLERRAEVTLTTHPSPSDPCKIPVDYDPLPSLVGPGSTLSELT
jgi:pyruvate kinase